MVIAITGASGHIGNNICRSLIKKGHTINALVFNEAKSLKGLNINQIKGDVTNKNDTNRLIEGADIVIHTAAKISIQGDKDGSVWKVNVDGTRNVVDSCIEYNVQKLIHFSSIHTLDPFPLDKELNESQNYVENGSAYDNSKIEGEKIVLAAVKKGLNANIVCPTSVFGINDYYPSLLGKAMIDLHKGSIPALPPGGYDFVDVQDVVKAVDSLLTKGVSGEKYLISGTYKSVKGLAEIVGIEGGVKTTQRILPLGFLRSLVPFFKLWAKLSGSEPTFTKESLKALTESNPYISSKKATIELDYSITNFNESINSTLTWFKENNYLK